VGWFSAIRRASLNVVSLLIQVLFLYYLVGEKGRYVCSAEYAEIIRRTPRVKETSWLLLVLLSVLIGLCIVVATAVTLG